MRRRTRGDPTWPAAERRRRSRRRKRTPRPGLTRREAAAKRTAAHGNQPRQRRTAYRVSTCAPAAAAGNGCRSTGSRSRGRAEKSHADQGSGRQGISVAMHADNLRYPPVPLRTSEPTGHVLNILVSPGVQGQITVNLDGVTVEQALEAILKLGNLSSNREGSLIYVFAPEEILMQGDRGQLVTRVYHLNYIRARDIEQMLAPFISDAGKLTVTPAERSRDRRRHESAGRLRARSAVPAARRAVAVAVVVVAAAAVRWAAAVVAASPAATRWPEATWSSFRTSRPTSRPWTRSSRSSTSSRFRSWSRPCS